MKLNDLKIITVTIIKGNPKFINNNPLATKYYQEIKDFLLDNGVGKVIFDSGDDYTCPPESDFYIGHSRGNSRIICFESEPDTIFLKFGTTDGISHELDLVWMSDKTFPCNDIPPNEHYFFIPEQQEAILKAIGKILDTYPLCCA